MTRKAQNSQTYHAVSNFHARQCRPLVSSSFRRLLVGPRRAKGYRERVKKNPYLSLDNADSEILKILKKSSCQVSPKPTDGLVIDLRISRSRVSRGPETAGESLRSNLVPILGGTRVATVLERAWAGTRVGVFTVWWFRPRWRFFFRRGSSRVAAEV